MKAPLNTIRLFIEIFATIAVAKIAVVFVPPVIATGVNGAPRSLLDAAMLGILAGPVILLRVRAAVQNSDRNYTTDIAAVGWRLKLGVVTVLAMGLALSLVGGWQIRSSIQAEARAHFQTLAKDALDDTQRRVDQAGYGLKGARGVYAVSKSVERHEFKAYADLRDIPKEFPGVLGFGFIERVMRPDLDGFITRERADDAPDFQVRLSAHSSGAIDPPNAKVAPASDLYIIKHIFPLEPNLAAWGFDAGSEPISREAIERAIATGQPAITGRISLVQQEMPHTGFLYLVPVFRNGTRPSTPAERMATLTGVVFTPINLEAVLLDLRETVGQRIDLELFDGTVTEKSAQLFDMDGHLNGVTGTITKANFSDRMFETKDEITIGGRTWTATLSTTPTFEAEIDSTTPLFATLGGATLTLLGAIVLWTIGTGHARAVALAGSMTRELREAGLRSERLAEIARRTSNAVIITDVNRRITWVNEGFSRISKFSMQEVVGKKPGEVLQFEKTDKDTVARLRAALDTGQNFRGEILNRCKDGQEYWLWMDIQPLLDGEGVLTGFMAIESEITERKLAEATLEETRDRLQAAVTGTNDGLWDWKVGTEDVWYSPRFWTLLGFIKEAEFPPSRFDSWSDRLHPDDSHASLRALQRNQTQKETYDVECRLRMVNGEYRWFRARGATQFDANAQPIRIAGSIQDIDDRKMIEEQLRVSALIDKLTGLPNRALLLDRLQQAIERHKRTKESNYAVLFLDFDRFKLVNDSMGHGVGDLLLREIARRLDSAVRTVDSVTRPTQAGTASRFGGDEFVILLNGLAAVEDAQKVADRILEVLSMPYMLDGHEVVSTASIGIVTSSSGHDLAEDVLRDADTAMYEVKAAGKGRAVMFDESMRVRVQRKVELEDGLRRALNMQQFRLFYQPIVSLETGRVEGFEALVRWQHPTQGMIPPEEFIPLAEETGLIIPLGEWIFKEACRQLSQWWKEMGRDSVPSISVNLSRKQLALADLPKTLAQIADDAGVDRSAIHLEITESAIMSNPEQATALLGLIKGLGFKVYMDDFGTGHSSLASLHQFPIDVIKIDRSFIANLSRGREFAALVNAICTLARNLNFKVVAEGVETDEQLTLLQALDCQLAQGFHFSGPMPADDVVNYLGIQLGLARAA